MHHADFFPGAVPPQHFNLLAGQTAFKNHMMVMAASACPIFVQSAVLRHLHPLGGRNVLLLAVALHALAKIRPVSVYPIIVPSRRVVIPIVCKRDSPIPIREVRISQLAEIPPGHCFVIPLLGNTRGKLSLSSGAGGMLLGTHFKQIHFRILRAADVFLFPNVPRFHRQHLLSLTFLLLNKSNPPSARECSRLAPAPA